MFAAPERDGKGSRARRFPDGASVGKPPELRVARIPDHLADDRLAFHALRKAEHRIVLRLRNRQRPRRFGRSGVGRRKRFRAFDHVSVHVPHVNRTRLRAAASRKRAPVLRLRAVP